MIYSDCIMCIYCKTDLINQMDGGAWTSMLTAKFFGTSDPISGRIVNSRWADLKVPYITEAFYKDEGIDPNHTFFPKEEDEWYVQNASYCLLLYISVISFRSFRLLINFKTL